MNKLKIGIMGASGRMGRMLIESTMNHPNTELGGGLCTQHIKLDRRGCWRIHRR